MPPASAAQGISDPDRGLGLSLLLGTDYERKKNKLKQELQLDYKHYVANKKDVKTSKHHPQPQGVSLPIDEKISVQEKLREERNKEYNLFLQNKAQIRKPKRGSPPITLKPGQVQASDAVCTSRAAFPLLGHTHTNIHLPPRGHPASRRDATTLTEAVGSGNRTGTRGPGHLGRRRWQHLRPKEPYSSEEELISDREEELEFSHRRRQDRRTPEYKEERKNREHKANRAPQDIRQVEAPGLRDQNNNEWVGRSDPQMPDSMRTAARSRPATSKDKAEFATGLMIGATEEWTTSHMRKEQYKQELLKQIAEQQRNKIREKKLELRVAASGATDPEKEPDRIKQFGAVTRHFDSWNRDVPYKPRIDVEAVEKGSYPRHKADKPTEDTEQRAPTGTSHVGYSTALSRLTGKMVPGSGKRGYPSLDYFNDDYHRDFSNMLGEVAVPRVTGVPPPVPPTVTNNYKTPNDEAYYYYGARNPLDLNLPYSLNGLPERVQQSGNIRSPTQRPPPLRPSGHTEATDQHRASPRYAGKSKQKKESALSYQEALRQQIKEREERKRREKEEKERYDAKIEAEMMAYNPWGRSGGGAPIKDQKGNLVSDLNYMHRINEDSYRNPVSGYSGQTQSFLTKNGHTPGAEAGSPLSHRLLGFNDQPTPQQLRMQNTYKEDLKQQIEENKRKQEKERELMRIEEDKEEKRLEDQRACMQREYEEEQRKQKKPERRLKNQSWVHEAKAQHHEEERMVRQHQELERKVPDSARDREKEKRVQIHYERKPSPPIPNLQKKQTNIMTSRPSSVLSQLSSRTENSMSAPHYQPVGEKIPQLQDGQQEVIRELSALRRYLRNEQRQLEVQLGQTGRQESHYAPPNKPRGRPRVDTFESAPKQAVQPSTRNHCSDDARVNMQNIREFNRLKYRDTASCEDVRHMYPNPPTDAHSLDIQQQALLREQQRKIRLMEREEEHDFSRVNKPGRYIHRDSILPSESTFIDVYSGDACEDSVHQQRLSQPSAEQRETAAPWRRHDCDELAVSMDQRACDIPPDAQPLGSATGLNLATRQDVRAADHDRRSEGLPGDEVEALSLRSALGRRVSVETVATEPWLRPGTSDAVKRSGCRERPNSRMDAPPWLTHQVT